jgi:diguanylate cyclase (GGDEF)-like protein
VRSRTDGFAAADLHRHLPLLCAPVAVMIDEHRATLQRRLEQDRFHDLFESVTSGIVIIDGDRQCALVNEAAGRLIGVPAGEHRVSRLTGPMRALRERCVNAAELTEQAQSVLANVDHVTTTIWDFGDQQYSFDTHPIRGDGRNGRILLFQDVTAERRLERDLRRLATSDPLTGLPNRRDFEDRARARIDAAGGNDVLSLLMIDIDRFKSINDTYGHGVGDTVLIEVARRARMALRAGDFVARMGGEEFAALLPMAAEADARAVAERIRHAIAHPPIAAGEHMIQVTVSIGGYSSAGEAHALEAMLRNADKALYQAKHGGRDRVVFRRPHRPPAA